MSRFYRARKKPGEKSSNIIIHQLYENAVIPPPQLDFWRLVSIDPGKVNLAFRIEKRYPDGRLEVEVFEKININNIDIVDSGGGTSFKDENLYFKAINFLNNYYQFFMMTNIIIIERQILPNYDMIRLCQHFITYFSLLLKNAPLKPILLEVEPGFKNRFFHMPKGANAHFWVTEKALEILRLRKDEKSIEIIQSHKGRRDKKDDLSVTIVQVEAVLQSLQWAASYPLEPPEFIFEIEEPRFIINISK